MANILARKKSTTSRSRKNSDARSVIASSTTPGDQKPREAKSAEYRDPRYRTLLATKSSFIEESELGITTTTKREYLRLLDDEAEVPAHSLFQDDLFKRTCRKIQDRNEAKVVQDITRLIVPSAETLATYGATNLQCLIESVNEGWDNYIPVTKTRPQPDHAVGFRREAFT
ncbi:Hypothetical protein R9X50_00533600 [Acrodontium crateriforme]|uniref:DUF7924 domain-containing protein n=1 Tax=Acrodontium crateriforme TaxID=150365 RepID=A0AAQ3M5X2_9PEZI|nr:Hypothetical protein R9X50_00533600 [Acrodontium crateriforme]